MVEVRYDAKEFGQRLKLLRKNHGKTQQELADLLYVSVDSISGYENGRITIGHDHIMKLCSYFNISADYFYRRETENSEQDQWLKEIEILMTGHSFEEKRKAIEILRVVFNK